MLFDLHVHSSISSCSRLQIDDMLSLTSARGLDGVCITDHHSMAIRHSLKEGLQDNGVCVIFGMEYSTPQGDFILFGPFEDLPHHLGASELLRSVRRSDGIAIAAHPMRKGRSVDEGLIRQGLCRVIESVNGRNSALENLAAAPWLRRYDVAGCAGSDAHTPEELGTITTRFLTPVKTRAELIHALHHRLFRPEIRAAEPGSGLSFEDCRKMDCLPWDGSFPEPSNCPGCPANCPDLPCDRHAGDPLYAENTFSGAANSTFHLTSPIEFQEDQR